MSSLILELTDELEQLVSAAVHVPIGSKIVLDERRCLDLLDQMRVQVPDAIREARRIQEDEKRIRADAREKANEIERDARDRANRLLAEHPFVLEAEQRAQDMIERAQQESDERRSGADRYVGEIINNLNRIVEARRAEVERGLDAMSMG